MAVERMTSSMGKSNREYRFFAATNFAPVEEEAGSYTVKGYFTTFNDPYPFGPEGCFEQIDRNAFSGTDLSDVIFQFDHDGMVLARQRNKTLEIGFDEHGGYCRASLGGCQQGRDLYEAISNGLVDRMSFGFSVAPDGWEWDTNTRTSTITKVGKLYDVSAVSIPANDGTEIHARSYLDGVIEAEHQELMQREADRRRRAAAAMELSKLS